MNTQLNKHIHEFIIIPCDRHQNRCRCEQYSTIISHPCL